MKKLLAAVLLTLVLFGAAVSVWALSDSSDLPSSTDATTVTGTTTPDR